MNEKNSVRPVDLAVGHYRFVFASERGARFSDFPGSAWRGALGHALKRTVCVTRQPQCRQCLLYRSCVYPYFYDTPPHAGAERMRRYETAPHPFVLAPQADESNRPALRLCLFGHANHHLAVMVHALTQAASGPEGVAGNRLTLEVIEQEECAGTGRWQTVFRPGEALAALPPAVPGLPAPPRECALEFLTPLRIKRDGRRVGPADLRFSDLFGNLLRRLSMLCYFHSDSPLETDFKGLNEAARAVPAHTELEWRDLIRYSARQKTLMHMGGVVGRIILRTADLTPFWPYLWLGQWTHAGSGATMGLGQYRIAASLRAHLESPT